KYLKAFLIQNRVAPPAIHDLQRLSTICLTIDKSFALISDDLDALNAYSVVFRYPGEGATVGESKKAFQIATRARILLKSKIKL
ncbi:MAG: HEPN domain-containing protein, partial [Sedimentisphaerales bacterium]|nr:HEPN domain-containing protein [Sedimentisphaerales bacterium]